MSGKVKMIGEKFGRWTVISELTERKNRNIYYHCKCECGKEKDVRGADLRNGSSSSCGCLRNERTSLKNSLDLLNHKFNRLTVIEKTNKRNNGMIVWKCKCECGNIIEVPSSYLTSKETQSCGCLQKERTSEVSKKDILNKTFGKLTVIEETQERYYKNIIWKCQCECGNIVKIPSHSLLSGATTSCGCIKSKGEEYIISFLKKKNITFETQKSFNSCRFLDTNALAKFDFYINNQFILEYDGIQHFDKTNNWYGKNNEHDNYKNYWCNKNNIPIYRIKYNEDIEKSLLSILENEGLV